MAYCPSCGAAFGGWAEECPDCQVPLEETPAEEPAPEEGSWTRVYVGAGHTLRVVEAALKSMGIPVVRLPGEKLGLYPTTAFGGEETTALWSLAVPSEVHRARQDAIAVAIASGHAVRDGDEEAIAEAEEDYDVRGCPECQSFFHDTYTACPGCSAELVPAVEIFEEGQLEPDRIVVGHGAPEEAKALSERLRAAGFDAEAYEMEGWSVAAVDLPWEELTARTAEAEAVLQSP